MSSGPSAPNGGGGGGNAPNYLPTPSMPGQGTYGAGAFPLGSYQAGMANISPYQQGLTPQQIQAGLGKLCQGMGLAKQSYNTLGQQAQKVCGQMGRMTDQFQNNANNAGNSAYNPAIGAYQQALNQNSQNIGAQLASQRGASADPGLAARNVGQAGAVAAQNAAGQMSSQVAAYKTANQQAAGQMQEARGQLTNQAYGMQSQAAGIYGNIANAYAQAGLANQGQILNAIAAQNAANVAMQSNYNSTMEAMQANINSAGVAQQSNINDVMAQQMMNNNNLQMQGYGMQLGYNSNLYNSYAGMQGTMNAGRDTGGLFGSGGFLGTGIHFSKGGEVGKHGEVPLDKKARFAQALSKVPKYAKGGRIPEPTRRKMAEGGFVKKYDDGGEVSPDQQTDQQDQSLSNMGGGDKSNQFSLGTNLNLMQALNQNDQNVMNQQSAGPQAPSSTVGKIMSGLMTLQGNPGFNRGGGGGGGGCMIGGALLSGGISAAQGGSFLGGAGASMGIGGAGAGAGAAGGADAAAMAAAAAHGGKISSIAKPMARAPMAHQSVPHLAKGGMPSHVTVPVAALRKLMDMAHVGKQAMQQKSRGGVIRAAQGAIIPQTTNPNMPGSMNPNIAMQSNISGGGMMGMGGGPQQQQQQQSPQQQGAGFMGPNIAGGQVQQQGPAQANFALAGSPNPQVAMPSTGMPMGNAQTAGGGPMPSIGMSSNVDPNNKKRPGEPPGMAFGGRMNPYGRSR